jgi:acyl transferase domain-containing protein
MAVRCPGATSVTEFWRNLKNGVESISFFTEDELRKAGISDAVLRLPTFIRVGGPLQGLELFDAQYFNYSAREAEFIDPQQRVFLECAVEALETAGVDPARHPGSIGVFAGEGQTLYGYQILANRSVIGVERQMAVIGNDKDYLATRTSYKLGLHGPSFTLQCACSTSTVALHLAAQSLQSHECDLALAGGVSVSWLRGKGGYHYVEGGILSRDGHTRAFDANASGTVFADGVALVVLKRLEDATTDGDNIQAVILGTAVNNDGATKNSFTAPSIQGQYEVLSKSLSAAGISPETIGYIEAHGTGTALGDPIEIEALQRVFRTATDKKQFCGVGSLKSNIGHLNTISGLAGTIKAALCVKTGEIPPSIHFETPNPKIDFANSPFYVPTELTKWSLDGPRRALVSAFGIGGTNTELLLEEPPLTLSGPTEKTTHVAILSAKTETALGTAGVRLARHLREHSEESIADVCHTLAAGRSLHSHVRAIVCSSTQDAAAALESDDPSVSVFGLRALSMPVTFLFPGQGAQHIYMGRELYQQEPVFRRELDKCAELLQQHIGLDLRTLLCPADNEMEEAEKLIRNTRYTQPAIFAVSYALAQLWTSLGVQPVSALGHSIGEFVAACIAEVFSLEDALRAVAERGRLIQSMPGGAMLAVMCPVEQAKTLFPASISLAAVNAPTACVASGPHEEIAALERRLAEKGISSTLLHTSHAFHSSMLEPAVGPFIKVMQEIELKPPQLPYISNVTGEWITDEQATDPNYWGAHMRAPVLFCKGVSCIRDQALTVLLEVGPGRTLGTLARSLGSDVKVLSSLPHASARGAGEVKNFLRTAAELWILGAPIDWSQRYRGERRLKRPLPTYPFERKRYWILDEEQPASVQAARGAAAGGRAAAQAPMRSEPSYVVETATWKRVQHSALANNPDSEWQVWLAFIAADDLQDHFARTLGKRSDKVTVLKKGPVFAELGDDWFSCDPNQEANVDALCAKVAKQLTPNQRLRVVYFCNPSRRRTADQVASDYKREVDDKVNAPITLIRSLTSHIKAARVELTFVTQEGQEVTGTERIDPMMALPMGPCLAGMHEYPGLNCRVVDIAPAGSDIDTLAQQLAADLTEPRQSVVTAYRGNLRWARTVESIPSFLIKKPQAAFRKNGVYLITGGLGALGLAVSHYLTANYQARLILTSRSALPPREEWSNLKTKSRDDKRLMRAIAGIERVEAAGGRVMVGAADVCDLSRMQAVVRAAYDQFGQIDGVIHAAGVPGTTPIGLKTPDELDQVLRPKILGLAVLEQVFAERDLDFLALFSSTSAIWGRVGQVDYAAANAYLDSYAIQSWNGGHWPTVSINWDNWREVGMAVDTQRSGPGQAKPIKGLSTKDGLQAFGQALVARHPQVIVRAARQLPQSQTKGAPLTRAGAAAAAEAPVKAKPKPKGYPRPALAQPYQEPVTDLEKALTVLWSELLMITPIGRNDNFFELGGHSLLGLQLLPTLRDKYHITIDPRELFANPTIAKLATSIEEKLTSSTPAE